MSKRKISMASKRRLTVFGTLSVLAIIYFIVSLFYNLYTIYNLINEKNKLEKNYIALQEEAENLKLDIEKLNDADYLANYARENYLYSKEGEYVLQLKDRTKETEEKIDIISNNIKKNYLIVGLSVIMIIILVSIAKKGKKRTKKRKKNKTL